MAETSNIRTLAEQPKPLPSTQDGTAMIAHFEAKLRPTTVTIGTAELAACLTLVAPTGLSARDRDEWIKVAKVTLSGMPADLFAKGCKAARETARFPSEIVPTIMAAAKDEWEHRKRHLAHYRAEEANRNAPRLPAPEYVGPAEVAALLKDLAGRATA